MIFVINKKIESSYNMPTIHLIITGKVQGVFYRAKAKETADRLGITGWVRNTDEGDVEAVATGTKEQIEKFIEWCRKGPQRAEVTNVEATEQEESQFETFEIFR